MKRTLTPEQHAKRLSLYNQGLGAKAMARALNLTPATVQEWRRKAGLPAYAPQPISEDAADRRQALIDSGWDDARVAAEIGVSKNAVMKWRHRNEIAAIRIGNAQTDAERAARMLLYSFGYSDVRIAKEQHTLPEAIRRWRKRIGLTRNRTKNAPNGRRVDGSATLLRRVMVALPKYLAPADRDDAANNLFLAVMSGLIPIDEIERRAKTFGNTVINDYASKWGAQSLDEDISDDSGGLRMIDMIRDDRSSSWLEEMGASAW